MHIRHTSLLLFSVILLAGCGQELTNETVRVPPEKYYRYRFAVDGSSKDPGMVDIGFNVQRGEAVFACLLTSDQAEAWENDSRSQQYKPAGTTKMGNYNIRNVELAFDLSIADCLPGINGGAASNHTTARLRDEVTYALPTGTYAFLLVPDGKAGADVDLRIFLQ